MDSVNRRTRINYLIFSFRFIRRKCEIRMFIFDTFQVVTIFIMREDNQVMCRDISVCFTIMTPAVKAKGVNLFMATRTYIRFRFIVRRTVDSFCAQMRRLIIYAFSRTIRAAMFRTNRVVNHATTATRTSIMGLYRQYANRFIRPIN